MKISQEEVQQYLARRSWLAATIQQIQKDLSWQNLEMSLSTFPSAEELQKQLSKLFSLLEQGQYQTLMNILYRVDIG